MLNKYRNGFTFIETLVALAVLGIFFAATSLIIQQVLINVGESRVRATAVALAQQKMEIIRNLPYTNVGTVGGIPQGVLAQVETVTINSLPFTVTTYITNIDDPYDNVAPNDILSADYKRVSVQVSWEGAYSSTYPVVFTTNIVPKGMESLSSTGGILRIQVFDANAQPIPNATVTIDNTMVAPEIHTQILTDSNGIIELPGSPVCNSCYQISVTKSGYSTDRTYSSSEVTNPLKPYVSVFANQISLVSFAIDRTSSIVLRSYGSRENGYPPIANVIFTLKGSKIIGYDAQDNPVYKYSYSTNTGGGIVSIPNLEWDYYTLDFSNSAHNLAGSNPIVPFPLNPGTSFTIPFSAVPKTNVTLLVTVKDFTGQLQSSASARLSKPDIGYSATKVTAATSAADFGQTFFGGLTAGTYGLTISLPGYEEASTSIDIATNQMENIILNAYSGL